MPATSKAQRKAAAVALHAPGRLSRRNRGMLSMSLTELGKLARTSEKGLPARAPRAKKG